MTTEAKSKEAAGGWRAVMAWAEANHQEHHEITDGEQEVLAHNQPIFTSDAIPTLTEKQFRSFLLLENNHHWALHR